MLEATTNLYEVDEEDKKTIIEVIIQYTIVLEVDMSNIKKKIPRVVWDALEERRHE